MIAPFHHLKESFGFHLLADRVQELQRAKRIASSLHKQDRPAEFAQNFISQPCRIASAAERVTEANHSCDRFFKSDVTADTPTHALSDQECRLNASAARFGQRLPV